MVNYSNGKIYKIICNITNECYIGSTCEPILARRLAGHVANYKSYLKGKGNNVTSFKIIANGNYNIVLIELFPCDTKDELYSRESHYTQTIQCVNKIKNQGLNNTLGKMEYIKQYSKQYDKANMEKIKYRKNTVLICQCGSSHTRINKLQHERSKKHQEYVENRLYYDIRRGLNMIKKLDNYFKNKV
jgi:hypothetical protein